MVNVKIVSSDTYAAIVATLFALTVNLIPVIGHWPIPSRGNAVNDYLLVIIMVSSPIAIMLSILAIMRVVKSGRSGADAVVSCICLIFSLGLTALYA